MADVKAVIRQTNVGLNQPIYRLFVRPGATIETGGGGGGVSSWNDLLDKPTEFPPEDHTHAIADVTGLQSALDGKQAALGFTPEDAADKGQPNGYASLDGGGRVPASQLPSFVDDVLEFADLAAFPVSGETGKMYVALDTGRLYRWSGSAYVEISASPGSTDAVVEGTGNLYFTEARVRSAALAGYAAAGARVALAATDTVLGAFNKIGKWLGDLSAIAFSGSASDLTDGTLPAARFNDTAHGTRAGGTLHANATTTIAGFMSGADKTKLDGVAAGANNYTHPNHSGDVASAADGATTLQPAAITGKPEEATAAAGDFVLISDTSDGGALKKVPVSGLPSGGGAPPNVGPLLLTGSATEYTIADTASEVVIVTATGAGYVLILPQPEDVAEGRRFVVQARGAFDIGLRVPNSTSFTQFTFFSGQIITYARGFEADGATPAWVSEHLSTTAYRQTTIEALFTQSYAGLAPLYVGIENALDEPGLDDGALWLTDTAFKVKVDGTVYDLTSPRAPAIHQATLDFGTPSVARRTFTVAHPGVLPTSRITMWQAGVAAPGRDVDENEMDQLHFVPVAGTDQITVYATCLSGTVTGSYVAQYQIGQAA